MFSFTETRLFSKLVQEYLNDEEYSALQTELIRNHALGPVIPGSGGVRKMRWAAAGRGKRGGYRVIYYVRQLNGVIWLLTMYPKNEADTISPVVLKQICKELEDDPR
jgi:mRNA-degrading endonuclease RelE of RelBE toxin-antitoxin system